jgi:catechol-2,3-dioxygenase
VPEFPSIAHVALTVRDLEVSIPWYERLFGSKAVLDEDTGPFRHAAWLVGSANLIALNQFLQLDDETAFNERRVGLDHLAFHCNSRGELESWRKQLDTLGIAHSGIVDADYGSVLSFRDPDNIALEFFAG